jgi:hypothetical protein
MQNFVKRKKKRDSLVVSRSVEIENIIHKIDKRVSPYIYIYIYIFLNCVETIKQRAEFLSETI